MAEFYYHKSRLFTPGPTPLVQEESLIYHRSQEFSHIFERCAGLLMPLFGSTTPPVILSSSGTGAMEACLVHLSSPGDRVVVVEGGKFGQRWVELAQSYGLTVDSVRLAWGRSVTAAEVGSVMTAAPDRAKVLLMQASETSTGAYHPVAEVAAVARELNPEIFIVVDGVSSLGAHPMKMAEWGIDGVVGGSQKGFGIPPGLAFVALSPRALHHESTQPRFYFDLRREFATQGKGQSAWTPAITLVQQLLDSLEYWHDRGLAHVYAQHQQAAAVIRSTLQYMGLELFAQDLPSYGLTSFKVPESLDGVQWLRHLARHYGAVFAGGQAHLKGQIMRMAHLGFFDRLDLVAGTAALEMSLKDLGHPCRSALHHLTEQLCVSQAGDGMAESGMPLKQT